MRRTTLIIGVAVAAASALLFVGYHILWEVPMFSWSSRTAPPVESRPLPPIDLAAPAEVETATFAVG